MLIYLVGEVVILDCSPILCSRQTPEDKVKLGKWSIAELEQKGEMIVPIFESR
jgi:hypothetical protein